MDLTLGYTSEHANVQVRESLGIQSVTVSSSSWILKYFKIVISKYITYSYSESTFEIVNHGRNRNKLDILRDRGKNSSDLILSHEHILVLPIIVESISSIYFRNFN